MQAKSQKYSRAVELAAVHFLCRLESSLRDTLRDEPSISNEDYDALLAIGRRWVERNASPRTPKAGAAFAATAGRSA